LSFIITIVSSFETPAGS